MTTNPMDPQDCAVEARCMLGVASGRKHPTSRSTEELVQLAQAWIALGRLEYLLLQQTPVDPPNVISDESGDVQLVDHLGQVVGTLSAATTAQYENYTPRESVDYEALPCRNKDHGDYPHHHRVGPVGTSWVHNQHDVPGCPWTCDHATYMHEEPRNVSDEDEAEKIDDPPSERMMHYIIVSRMDGKPRTSSFTSLYDAQRQMRFYDPKEVAIMRRMSEEEPWEEVQ